MSEEDWGFFVDLEMLTIKKEPQIKKFKNVVVIYEEELWYKRDEEDYTDYENNWDYNDGFVNNPNNPNNPKEKNKIVGNKKDDINKTTLALYCFVCVSFISLSTMVLL
jgi:hypothetical protein